ncbi:MAG: urease accessory protein UreE [Burkholderiales bacterium]|nr:urease accessory protein UreE [Burkholderiales bacterium]
MVIEAIVGKLDDLGAQVKSTDPIELTADLRTRPHFRRPSLSGTEIVVSLPRGTMLDEGDVLQITDGVAVVVRAAPEDLLEVRPRTALEWGVTAYQLGNLHRDVRFRDDCLLSPYEESTEQVLKASGVPYARVLRSFSGARYGAYTGHPEHPSLVAQRHRHTHGAPGHVDHEHV